MKLRRVSPKSIRVPEVRVTARMDEETTEQFRSSVETAGIDEPIKCYEVDGVLWLSDGKHRLLEALRLNLPLVDVYVREGSMVDVLCNNLMSGHLRGKHPPSEMVKVIEELYKIHKVGIEAIVKRTGLTQAYVENLILISELTPKCRLGLDEGLIGVGHALALTKIKDPVVQETIFMQQTQYHWKVAELEAYIRDVLAIRSAPIVPQAPAAPVQPVLIRCFYCGLEGEPAMFTNPNTCRECGAVMLMSMRQAARELAADKKSTDVAPAVQNPNV